MNEIELSKVIALTRIIARYGSLENFLISRIKKNEQTIRTNNTSTAFRLITPDAEKQLRATYCNILRQR